MMMTQPSLPDRDSTEHQGAEEVQPLDFSRGLNLMQPPHKLEDGFMRDVLNMYYPRETGILKTRPGLVEWATETGAEITAIHVYRQSETVSYVVFTAIDTTQHLYYIDPDTDTPVVISHDLGSLLLPSMVTFNGCLYVAIPGQHIMEWQGYTGTDPAAGYGTADVTFTGIPVADQILTVGTETWTWKATRTGQYEVTIGGGDAACATNLSTAINTDSSIVEAIVHGGDNTVCHVTARRLGTAGNLATSETMDNATVSGSLAGGVNGLGLDSIDTYQAPHPSMMIVDWNQRLVVSGDPAAPDYVYFSTPQDPWQWATGAYGGGETFYLGYKDGMDITAIHEMFGDLVVHKAGQGRTIYRITTSDPDPSTWTSTVKRFNANTSAINSRCVEACTDKHVYLDTRGFASLSGTDTYDEIGVGQAGQLVADQLSSASPGGSFFITNPDENYIMIFTQAGTACWVFHYGSGRWARWQFETESPISCGCYDDNQGTVVFGTQDGRVLMLDPQEATDDGNAFASQVVTRAFGGGGLKLVLIKQVLLDWRNVIGGEGSVGLLINNETNPSQALFDFEVDDTAVLLSATDADAGGENIHLEDATWILQTSSYGRFNSFNQGGGELVSLRIRLNQGAYWLNGASVRVAYHGRVAQ